MNQAGAFYEAGQCKFSVWAPEKATMHLVLTETGRHLAMEKDKDGYFNLILPDVRPGLQYRFQPADDGDFPDPASHFQPHGVHGPSEVIDHQAFQWVDVAWRGLPLKELVLYEIHTGTFTPDGTFAGIIARLDELVALGINAIELMPVAQFPGNRNWGYDMVFPYAVQETYGGPEGLKALVDAAHGKGIAVFLDVVFNHIGPEGNYFSHFGPYFTDQYATPWGNAINFDGDWSDGVREYFCNAILHWYEHYHIDGLRVDAVHMMYDNGAVHFWELVYERLELMRQQLGRDFYLIAESDLNSPRVVKTPEFGGWGFNAQWLDDFHHALYVLLDDAGRERYEDFGDIGQLAKAYTDGFVHSGEYVRFRKRKFGASSVGIPGERFVIFNQNHDQVGNRVGGERLSMLVDFERQKIAAAAILLAPYVPMLFMGEEYGADTPFFYFVSHSEEELINAVVEGRRKEFENYQWDRDPPNPQDESTFEQSRIDWDQRRHGRHALMLEWHRTLLALRKSHPALQNFVKNDVRVTLTGDRSFMLRRISADHRTELICTFNLGENEATMPFPGHMEVWKKTLDSGSPERPDGKSGALPDELPGGETLHLPGLHVAVFEGRKA